MEYYFHLFGKKISKKEIDDILNLVNLHDVSEKNVGEFSLGMKQRLGIAIALINDARLLLLDEPTNGLDPIGIVEIRKLILKIAEEKNISILISSHILSELEQLANCFGFLNKGKIISEISAKNIDSDLNRVLYIKVENEVKFRDLLHKMFLLNDTNYNPNNNFFTISTKLISINSFLKELVYNDIVIIDFNVKKTNLEDYYLRAVSEEER